jgi:hypothetical protein
MTSASGYKLSGRYSDSTGSAGDAVFVAGRMNGWMDGWMDGHNDVYIGKLVSQPNCRM